MPLFVKIYFPVALVLSFTELNRNFAVVLLVAYAVTVLVFCFIEAIWGKQREPKGDLAPPTSVQKNTLGGGWWWGGLIATILIVVYLVINEASKKEQPEQHSGEPNIRQHQQNSQGQPNAPRVLFATEPTNEGKANVIQSSDSLQGQSSAVSRPIEPSVISPEQKYSNLVTEMEIKGQYICPSCTDPLIRCRYDIPKKTLETQSEKDAWIRILNEASGDPQKALKPLLKEQGCD